MKPISREEYAQIVERTPVLCVDIVIYHKGKVLLVYRKNEPAKNNWWLPGGRVYKNERLETAAIRKSLEETGLKVKIKKKLNHYEFFSKRSFFNEVTTGTHTLSVGFLVQPLSELKINLDKTSSNFKWIGKIEDNLHPFVKQIIKDSGVLK